MAEAYGDDDHELSINTPFIQDEKEQRVVQNDDVEANNYDGIDDQTGNGSGTSSSFSTCFHGLNALSGVGILSVPYALATGGWLSLILLFVISMAAFYSGLLIQRCMDMDTSIRTYPDIGELAFGRRGKIFISVIMYAELYLVATGFLILEGDNLNNLLPNAGLEILGLKLAGQPFFVMVVGLIILPTVWLDNMSLLSYVSASGVLASVIIIVSILWTGAFDGIGFHQKGILLNWHGIPTAVSLFAFCYCAHPVFPTLYTSMKNKHQFSNVMLVCFILCTFGYASMAVLGYSMFGQSTLSQITLNLPTHELSSRIAIYTTLVNPLCKYALMVTPIVNEVKTWFPCHCINKRSLALLIGTSLLISNVTVALAIPDFANLISFIGALLSVTASIILPCLCYLKISGCYRRLGGETLLIMSIILMGVVIAVVGTYTSLVELIEHI